MVGGSLGHSLGQVLVEFLDLFAEVEQEGVAGPAAEEHDHDSGDAGEEESHSSGRTEGMEAHTFWIDPIGGVVDRGHELPK